MFAISTFLVTHRPGLKLADNNTAISPHIPVPEKETRSPYTSPDNINSDTKLLMLSTNDCGSKACLAVIGPMHSRFHFTFLLKSFNSSFESDMIYTNVGLFELQFFDEIQLYWKNFDLDSKYLLPFLSAKYLEYKYKSK